jgi:hypothetical protein
MPPKKRPAAAGAATSAAKRKKASIGRTSITGEPDTPESHASGRPKRSSVGEPTYNATAAKKLRTEAANSGATSPSSMATAATAKRGRGRPRKDAASKIEEGEGLAATPTKSPSRPVGKPRKSASAKFTRIKSRVPVAQNARQAKKKATQTPKSAGAPTTKPRGRPKGSTTTKATGAAPTTKRADKVDPKPKGTKAKEKAATSKVETDEELDGLTANESEWEEGHEDEGKQYWLMKAEPDSRVENGVDLKFSIDDLMNAEKPEGWDGMASPCLGVPQLTDVLRCAQSCGKEQNACHEKGRSGILLSLQHQSPWRSWHYGNR